MDPEMVIEVLTPDFNGREESLQAVLDAGAARFSITTSRPSSG